MCAGAVDADAVDVCAGAVDAGAVDVCAGAVESSGQLATLVSGHESLVRKLHAECCRLVDQLEQLSAKYQYVSSSPTLHWHRLLLLLLLLMMKHRH